MKKSIYKKLLLTSITLLLISAIYFQALGVNALTTPNITPFLKEDFWALDNNSTNTLPERFRNIQSLNISGSAEFRPSQIENLIKAINKEKLVIVDLRQETHGFIDDYPVNYSSVYKIINNGLNSKETLKAEKSILSSIKLNSNLDLFNNDSTYFKTITATTVLNEYELVKKYNLDYKRFAVLDNAIPSPKIVDDFVNFIVNLPKETHVHFHCHAGEGRTTTFMSMFEMMQNKDKVSLETILKNQAESGGIVLTQKKSRATFLELFYQYTIDNIDTNFKTPYSTWLAEKNL
ncbi:hypothetical protein JCM1393_17380 [Clostridium carnis]